MKMTNKFLDIQSILHKAHDYCDCRDCDDDRKGRCNLTGSHVPEVLGVGIL
jgi:hypothetical protein